MSHQHNADVPPLAVYFFTEQEPQDGDLIELGPSITEGFASLSAYPYFGRWNAARKELVAADLLPLSITGRRGWCWRWVSPARLILAELHPAGKE